MYGGLSRAFAFPFFSPWFVFPVKIRLFSFRHSDNCILSFLSVSSLISGTSLLISMIYDSLAKKNNQQNTKNIFILGFVLLSCIIILFPSLRKGQIMVARISEKEHFGI